MSGNLPSDADGEDEWATVGAPAKPRRLAPQTTLTRPEFVAQPAGASSSNTPNKVDEEAAKASAKNVVRFSRDELLEFRPKNSEVLASMSDIPDIISLEPIDPEVLGLWDHEDVVRLWQAGNADKERRRLAQIEAKKEGHASGAGNADWNRGQAEGESFSLSSLNRICISMFCYVCYMHVVDLFCFVLHMLLLLL